MKEATKAIRLGTSAIFWGGLPLLVLVFSLYYVFNGKLNTGWARIPLHPRGIATVLFTKPERGLSAISYKEPYRLLGFSKAWKQATLLSQKIDSLVPALGTIRSRAGQWIYRPEGSAAYIEVVELEEDSLSIQAWQGIQPREVYLSRELTEGAKIAEPREPSLAPCILFWKKTLIFCQEPVSLEELVEKPLSIEIERLVPVSMPFGLVLHIDQWGLGETDASVLPFYPIGRMAGGARTLVLLPQESGPSGWAFSGLAHSSVKGLHWPQVLRRLATKREGLPEDGWLVRIGQGMAGNRFLLGIEDSLAPLRKEIADNVISVRLALPPALPSGFKQQRVELLCTDAKALHKAIQKKFPLIEGGKAYLGNVPKSLIGLPLSGFDTCFVTLGLGEYLVLSNYATTTFTPSKRLSAGQDLELQFSPNAQWGWMLNMGPKPMRDMRQTLPITLSRFARVWLNLVGDGVQVSVTLHPEALLGTRKVEEKPSFVNLFNSTLKAYGQVHGKPKTGYALSQTGRLYFFNPGSISFAQFGLDTAMLQTPPTFSPIQKVYFWQAGDKLYSMDSTGKLLSGFPTACKTKHLVADLQMKQLTLYGLDSTGALEKRVCSNSKLSPNVLPDGRPKDWLFMGNHSAEGEFQMAFKAKGKLLILSNGKAYTFPESWLAGTKGVGFANGTKMTPTLVSVSSEGMYHYQHLDKTSLGIHKQLYKPEQNAHFEIALEAQGKAIGVVRYTPTTTSFYNLKGLKQWEIPINTPLTWFTTGGKELDIFSLGLLGDTLMSYNTLGTRAFIRLGTYKLKPQLFPLERGDGFWLAIPSDRELRWYKVGR